MMYTGTLIAVTDMDRSRRFYHDVLGLHVTSDLGVNVTLDGGISLQTAETWRTLIGGRDVLFHHNACELYFEVTDMDGFLDKLRGFDIDYIHEPLEHDWGQRVVRFYDPDHHAIEVGEDMVMVVRRFVDGGMTAEEAASRMGVPLGYVLECLG